MDAAVRERRDGEDRLAHYLRVLGVPNRVALLRTLQVPKAMSEIQLSTSRRSAAGTVGRAITRQGIQRHLAALAELGLVVTRAGQRSGRPVTEYVVNHARLFIIAEELGRLSAIRPISGNTSRTAARSTAAGSHHAPPPIGPALVLANGPLAGAAFPLKGDGPWLIGREENAAVALRYDPFVSRSHALVRRERRAYVLEALTAGRNGTRLNWNPLAPNRPTQLSSGDALGVGRSLLFLRGL